MTRVLLVESQKLDFQMIKNTLSSSNTETFQLQWTETLTIKELKKSKFEAILLSQDHSLEESFSLLKKILALKLDQPVIFLTDVIDTEIDQQMMLVGADDCLAKSELTTNILVRTINHAIIRKRKETQFAYLSTHDQLTGLANRYLLYEHLERTISIAKRSNSHFSVLLIDIDKFKLINNSLGHDIGDILLVQVADRLSTSMRDTDIVARFGNDEFAVLLEDSGTSRNMVTIAMKIQRIMEASFEVREHELFITTSIGLASFPECGTEPETLLKSADAALHKAKELGRNKYHYFTSELNEQAKLRLELEKGLRRALINCELEIYLQPQVETLSQKVSGAEALLRWNHPQHGMVSPEIFIPLLEDLGMLPGIEGWVLQKVCLFAKKMTDRYGQLKFSVNISGSHFKSERLKENIYMALQGSSLDAIALEIELTENIMIEHVEHNSNLLNELKELGVWVALDDFGKGYSSLTYLKNFPADILKIDKAFIDNIVDDKRDEAIVEAMINLSHKLGIKVVAEGVENKNQLVKLEVFGCDYIQGYYFAKPMPMPEFEKFLVNRNQLYKQKNHSG